MRELYVGLMIVDDWDFDVNTNSLIKTKRWDMIYGRSPNGLDDFYDEGTPGTYGDDVMNAIHAVIGQEDVEGGITLKGTPYDPAKIGKEQAIRNLTNDMKKYGIIVINKRTDMPTENK